MDKVEAILKSSQRMFATQGYFNTPISEIADDAGVASGTVIYYFKSKENLLFILTWNILNRMYKRIASAATQGDNGLERLLHCARSFLESIREDPDGYKVLLVNAPFQALDMNTRPTSDLKYLLQRQRRLVQEIIEQGIEDGSVRSDIVPLEGALGMLSLVVGSCHMVFGFECDFDMIQREMSAGLRTRFTA